MELGEWYSSRGMGYVGRRAAILLSRYGLSPARAAERVHGAVKTLAQFGCAPTFPTPGRVLDRYPRTLGQIQEAGAELAVHGYDHVALSAYPPDVAIQHLARAAKAFFRHGIEVFGFRCPYLSCTDELVAALPRGIFDYSSNRAVMWDTVDYAGPEDGALIFNVLNGFYRPSPASETVCVPSLEDGIVEIPVSLPDDIQLYDGLGLDAEGLSAAWMKILQHTHLRGELFVLQFHPELAWRCQTAFEELLQEASSLTPAVWMARLCDISAWWKEKAQFEATVTETSGGLDVGFHCSDRATVLARGLENTIRGQVWDGVYQQLDARTLHIPALLRPLVGLGEDVPRPKVEFLRDQGYLVDASHTARQCSVFLDGALVGGLRNNLELVRYIEASDSPLLRFGRWPNGAASAISITGDLDALTLLDYAARLWTH